MIKIKMIRNKSDKKFKITINKKKSWEIKLLKIIRNKNDKFKSWEIKKVEK